jgi:acetyl-CoA synthetase
VEGEICVSVDPRVPGIFKEYYKNPEKTAETLRDGWHHTGDVAWKDEDGYFWYSGRNDDLIKSSGYRISPFEIESVLLEHPAVLECAVTGVPDAVRGQLVKATIILRNGYEPSDELKKEIQVYAKNNTSPYKYPRVVEFVKELPKSISGKIKRVDIREQDEADHRARQQKL